MYIPDSIQHWRGSIKSSQMSSSAKSEKQATFWCFTIPAGRQTSSGLENVRSDTGIYFHVLQTSGASGVLGLQKHGTVNP